MMVIKPDFERRIDIPGVPAPVRRPVDIDQAKTGFTSLRTLRIYRFDQASTIEGHAEEDEVFLIVMAGSIELTISDGGIPPSPVTLSATEAAYLPPGAAYKLIAHTEADVAYARATPSGAAPAKVFFSARKSAAAGFTVLLEEAAYAERLRLLLVHFDARDEAIAFAPVKLLGSEALVHIRCDEPVAAMISSAGSPAWLESWDTLAGKPGDDVTLMITKGCSGLALIVTALVRTT